MGNFQLDEPQDSTTPAPRFQKVRVSGNAPELGTHLVRFRL